ncbi:MAG: hypothetical protein IPG39_16165 [Bacteroidetes bacterium]|nr:hypothetical protein [Bacteroidota bacterium]
MHNSDDDFSFADCPASSGTFNMRPIDDTFLPYEITPGANFYSSYWDNTVNCINGSTPGKIKGPLNSTFSDLLLYELDDLPAGHIPFTMLMVIKQPYKIVFFIKAGKSMVAEILVCVILITN